MLAGVNLLGRKKETPPPQDTGDTDGVEAAADSESDARTTGKTAPKGRPTPKRAQAQGTARAEAVA
jgi:hypothetical protein